MRRKEGLSDSVLRWHNRLADDENGLGISTTLPAGRKLFIYPNFLSEELQRRARYSPHRIAEQLSELHTRMSAELER